MIAQHSFPFLSIWTNSSIKIPNGYQPIIRRYTPDCVTKVTIETLPSPRLCRLFLGHTRWWRWYTFFLGSLVVIILSLIGTGSLNMSSIPKSLRFVYGRWRIDTPEVKSCVNILEVEGGKQCVKMSSMVNWKSNCALTYRKSRGVSNMWKWVGWKEKVTTWTFHVLRAWNGRKSTVRIL